MRSGLIAWSDECDNGHAFHPDPVLVFVSEWEPEIEKPTSQNPAPAVVVSPYSSIPVSRRKSLFLGVVRGGF